jgi:signal transduction histidine kinase
VHLIGGANGTIYVRDGEVYRPRAHTGLPPEFIDFLEKNPARAGRHSATGRVILNGAHVAIEDVLVDADYEIPSHSLARSRSILAAPLLRQEVVEGVLVIARKLPGAFTSRQIELLQTFADQALIAIENSRLIEQVRARTRDLEESLAQQTATAEVLKTISRSAFDPQTVLEALINSAVLLSGSANGLIWQYEDGAMRCRAFAQGESRSEFIEHMRANPQSPGRGSITARVALTGEVQNVADITDDPEYSEDLRRIVQRRATLGVPMKRGDQLVGAILMSKETAGVYPERIVDLVKTFADQAVIAIENARLFEEVQARTRDLSEALQQQTATSDVLKVISRSAFDLQAVFNTLVTSAVELGGALTGTICVRDGDVYRYRDTVGAEHTSALAQYLRDHPAVPGRSTIAGRVLLSGRIERIPDCQADPEYVVPMGALASNVRSLLGVPLLRKEGVEGAIILTRAEAGDFTERQIEIVQTFADQAVIALENVRLFDEVQARTRELAASLDDLRRAQDRLVASEKLASLGQLTAGIAHEIKNPLNFVNNFSALSRELLDELRELLAKAKFAEPERGEADELIGLVASNLDKVATHGKRADSIVKNMLLHSREGSGERTSVNVNAMVEEALNLAYHGARAEKPGFNVTIEKSLDPAAGAADLYPQEITRVLLNLISNGFYATTKRKQSDANGNYEPTVSASTRNMGDRVAIVITDNGTGIPEEVQAKMFNPFFTTKPAGEGTGLGLSLSHDIVVKQHGGTLEVATEPGSFTAFTIVLPRDPALLKPRSR